jgi:RNA polymerase sigma-70 factor (ECF subfamily)
LSEVTHLRSYLYRIAKNLVFDEVRRQQRQVSTYAQVKATSNPHLLPADSALIDQQYQELTQVLINQLPAKRRQIFILRTQDELTLDEIANQLAISKSVVKKQFYAAIEFMKKKLVPDGHIVASVGGLWLMLQVFAG